MGTQSLDSRNSDFPYIKLSFYVNNITIANPYSYHMISMINTAVLSVVRPYSIVDPLISNKSPGYCSDC